jgi:hypothetical protein
MREHVLYLLRGGGAHVHFDDAVKGLPGELRGKKPRGTEHSPWQILEHIRIAQWDILRFSKDAKHASPKWPDDYWPKKPAPPDSRAWAASVRKVREDLEAMCALVADESVDLLAKIPHGQGQTILREALLIADHNAYHLGELVTVRRLLGAWK